MDYKEFLQANKKKDPDNILPNGTDAQEAVDILVEHFLGHPIIYGYPATVSQANTEFVAEILRRYPQGKILRIKPMYKDY